MSTLRVQFGFDPTFGADAPVVVDVVGEDLRRVARKAVRLGVGPHQDFTLSPGSYLVRATLPSGEILSAQKRVSGDTIETVLLEPTIRSPRETLTWAYALKPVSRKLASDEAAVWETITSDFKRASAGWMRLWHFIPEMDWHAHPFPSPIEREIAADGPPVLASCTTSLPPGSYWLQVGGVDYPWKMIALPSSKQIRVAIVRDAISGQDDDPLNVLVDGWNPAAEALLGYLTSGNLEAARTIADETVSQASELLDGKRRDPYAASVGGYFLLRAGRLTGDSGHGREMVGWTENLANWFEWLPDGSVIRGWVLLRRGSDWDGARTRFLEAVDRGIPLFSQGVRLLCDGLALVAQRAQRDDRKVNDALARVQRYAAAMDWQSGATSYFGRAPSEPDSERVYGQSDSGADPVTVSF